MTDEHCDARIPSTEENEVANLYRLAGPAPVLPEEEVEPIREAAREAFLRSARRRLRRRITGIAAALAACVAILLVVGPFEHESVAPPSAPLATVTQTRGVVSIHPGAEELTGPGELGRGGSIRTGSTGRVALSLAERGGSLRFDGGSRARLRSSRSVVLERGALYYDSTENGRGIVVHTPLGEVSDVGTRFEVRLLADAGEPGGLLVRVRDGDVAVRAKERELRLDGGAELVLRGDGTKRVGSVAPDAPEWEWAVEAAFVPPIEGASLQWFLDWVSHELGVTWRLTEPRPELEPEATVLHGSVEGLTPSEALELVLAGAGLQHERIDGEIRVSASTD